MCETIEEAVENYKKTCEQVKAFLEKRQKGDASRQCFGGYGADSACETCEMAPRCKALTEDLDAE